MSEHTELSFQHLQHSFQLNIKLQFWQKNKHSKSRCLKIKFVYKQNKIKSNNKNKSTALGSISIFYLYSSARITIEMVSVGHSQHSALAKIGEPIF